jgi:hypothetical protein
MTTQLKTTNYDIINTAIYDTLSTGQYSYAAISIFTNGKKTTLATDSNSLAIENRPIQTISQTLAHVNENGDSVNPTVTIDFTDGTTFTSDDVLDKFWYTVSGIPIVLKTF